MYEFGWNEPENLELKPIQESLELSFELVRVEPSFKPENVIFFVKLSVFSQASKSLASIQGSIIAMFVAIQVQNKSSLIHVWFKLISSFFQA